MKFNSVRGTKDICPPEIELWQYLEKTAVELLQDYGFSEIRTPIFEESGLFNRSIGEDTDIVEKEMYTFADKKGRSLTLRPEGTAGVVRAAIENNLLAQGNLTKLYYLGPMFRYERPQAGRYRQFYQIGAESIGSSSYWRDVEIILWCVEFFSRIGLSGIKVYINSVGCPECRPGYREVLQKFLQENTTQLCADCQRRMVRNPLRVLDCKVETCRQVVSRMPAIQNYLCQSCRDNFQDIQQALQKENITFTVDKFLVRGLDYYTQVVFEIKSENLGAQDAVAAGGRYDKLVKELGGPDMPAVGFALGMERVSEVLKKQRAGALMETWVDIYFALLGKQAQQESFNFIRDLRQSGLKVEACLEDKSLKNQMRQADQGKAKLTVIIGEEEIRKGIAMVRDMQTKEQKEIKLNDLVSFLKELKLK
ncbi:MAG: histidine--tRNA ligase [bacterium]|nr:histidine--tRNA ligase [bacterium]MDD5354334.1 histidine--tRNA ligase [bacterium]MDD5756518.1 histidine--tRNA ligase [bacterium]